MRLKWVGEDFKTHQQRSQNLHGRISIERSPVLLDYSITFQISSEEILENISTLCPEKELEFYI